MGRDDMDGRRRRSGAMLASIALPALVLIAGPLKLLTFNGYPLTAPEAMLALAIAGGAGLVIGSLLVLLGHHGVTAIIAFALIVVFLDAQVGLSSVIGSLIFDARGEPRLIAFVLAAPLLLVLFLGLLRLGENFTAIAAAGLAAFVAGILLVPGETAEFGVRPPDAQTIADAGPLYLHIVLDGQSGIERAPPHAESLRELGRYMTAFYSRWGFRLNGDAYSPYDTTLNSLAHVLNAEMSSRDRADIAPGTAPGMQYELTRNRLFDELVGSGRALSVYQTDFLDFCAAYAGKLAKCLTYPALSVRVLERAPLGVLAKARLLLAAFYGRSTVVGTVSERWYAVRNRVDAARDSDVPADHRYRTPRLFPVGVPDVVAQLQSDIEQSGGRGAWFAHLTLPHDPFVWSSECKMQPDIGRWLDRRNAAIAVPGYRESHHGKVLDAYAEQVRCTMRLLDALLADLERAGRLDTATIVIHGDHGSRIVRRDPSAAAARGAALETDVEDLHATYWTLYAVRSPAINAGYDATTRSLPALVANDIFGEPLAGKEPVLFLRTFDPERGWSLSPRPLPDAPAARRD